MTVMREAADLLPHFRVGIVVVDILVARGRRRELLGVIWAPVLHLAEE